MLRITDTRTGHLVEVPAAPRRLLRSRVHLPDIGTGPPTGTGPATGTGIGPLHLRVPLIGDVLARTAELNGLQVVTVLTTPELTPDRARALDRVMAVLGIHPPAVVGAHRPEAALGGPADVHVVARDAVPDDAQGGALIEVGRVVTAPQAEGVPDPGTPDPADTADPLAVRLLLLSSPHGTPVTVTGAALAGARQTLRDWRRSVADWAQEPSRPIPADLLRQSHEALAEDLDVASVLALLAGVAARSDVPAGAKFETFAHLDRVLGLDLARDVGHQRPTGP
ncbi:hypothetical protein ACFVH0_12405 [Streptomyces sp. NPDC127117]|uniref:hypothetical protein n=1 Tax=Streptomyces sp. NPDC127117 TaxID=3345368 RepID=UPI0036376E6F